MKTPLTAIAVLGLLSLGSAASAKDPIVLGWLEYGIVSNKNIRLAAKLDTGARTTSLHTEDAKIFKKDGKRWVRFTVLADGKAHAFELPVHRMVRIRRFAAPPQRRPVVLMPLCLGTHKGIAEVNLNNRKKMRFPLLIGRRFLDSHILVHSKKTYTTEPNCSG